MGWKCSRNLDFNVNTEVKRSPQKMYICLQSQRGDPQSAGTCLENNKCPGGKLYLFFLHQLLGLVSREGCHCSCVCICCTSVGSSISYKHEPHPSMSDTTNNVRWVLQAARPRFHCHKATNTSEVAPSADGTKENSKVPNTASKTTLACASACLALRQRVYIASDHSFAINKSCILFLLCSLIKSNMKWPIKTPKPVKQRM